MPWRVVPPDSDRISRVPSYSGIRPKHSFFSITRLSLSMVLFPKKIHLKKNILKADPTTPTMLPSPVWALPRSLAATSRISFDYFSYRYLDVSVPCVRSLSLLDS